MSRQGQALSVLIVSTLAFTVCFMVWMMFGVIGIPIKKQLGLNATEFGLLTATPVLTGSLIRVPLGNERSTRIEVRSVAPDANPYLVFYTLMKTAMEGTGSEQTQDESKRSRTRFLPDNIYDAIRLFKGSKFSQGIFGDKVHEKFAELKNAPAAASIVVKGSRFMKMERVVAALSAQSEGGAHAA